MDVIERFIKDPQNRELLQTVKSMRNGIVYGGRLRFAHTLVINLLFKRSTPLLKRLNHVFKMTKDHGLILACFALIYRTVLFSLNHLFKKKPIHEFIAGCIGGALVYGNQTKAFNHSIAHQITLFCSARVLLGIGKLLAYKIAKYTKEHREAILSKTALKIEKKHLRARIQHASWMTFATISWGAVMYLHRFYPAFLQHSLESSMVYIYDDTDWNDLRSLILGV